MDPITRAAAQFSREAEDFWNFGRGQVLRMVVRPAERTDLAKHLRAREWAPGNRRPLFLCEQPFESAEAYITGVCAQIAKDYEAVRLGLSADGVKLPALLSGEPGRKIPNSAPALHEVATRAATLLSSYLDGAVVALIPRQVAQPQRWREFVASLLDPTWARCVRLCVYDPPDGPLTSLFDRQRYPERGQAHLLVDPNQMLDYFRQATGGPSAGPPIPPSPQPSEAQRREFEQTTGIKVVDPAISARLRGQLLEAAEHSAQGRPDLALGSYQAALDLCRDHGLVREESMMLLALGGGLVAAGAVERSVDAYRQAAAVAQDSGLWAVASQAWLGAGGGLLRDKQYLEAATAYEDAAAAAGPEKGQVPQLRIEALRMAGTSYLIGHRRDEAQRCWQAAVADGLELAPAERGTFAQVTTALIDLLDRQGLRAQAEHIRELTRSVEG